MPLLLQAKPLDGDSSFCFPSGAGGAEDVLLPSDEVSGVFPLEVLAQRLGPQLELVALDLWWGKMEGMSEQVVAKTSCSRRTVVSAPRLQLVNLCGGVTTMLSGLSRLIGPMDPHGPGMRCPTSCSGLSGPQRTISWRFQHTGSP